MPQKKHISIEVMHNLYSLLIQSFSRKLQFEMSHFNLIQMLQIIVKLCVCIIAIFRRAGSSDLQKLIMFVLSVRFGASSLHPRVRSTIAYLKDRTPGRAEDVLNLVNQNSFCINRLQYRVELKSQQA